MAYGTIKVDTIENTNGQTGNAIGPGFKNRIINGDMRIAQRGTTAVGFDGAGGYPVDRWAGFENGSMVFSGQQSTTVPTGAGFVNSIIVTTTTAASPGSTTRSQLTQYIEGFNIADFGFGTASAKTITLSFWVRSSLTGQFGGAVQSGTATRSYPFSYTISSANTWEYKTITIPGDTTGTWATDNSAGLGLIFDLGMGSGLLGTAGAWAAADYRGATGDVKLSETLNATFYITGVQLEVGPSATSFDYRPYGTELALCQRYCYATVSLSSGATIAVGQAYSATQAVFGFVPPVPFRATPTLTRSGLSIWNSTAGSDLAVSALSVSSAVTPMSIRLDATCASGLSAGNAAILQGTSSPSGSGSLILSAEL